MVNLFAVTIIQNPTSEIINVRVSNSSVNRIVLPFKILDISYSKEKGIKIKVVDNQAFIKYVPVIKQQVEKAGNQEKKVGEPKVIYNKAKPAEVFFVTEKKTYAFNLIPRYIKAQTIIVNDYSKNIDKALKYETEDDYIKTLSKISKQVLLGKIPQGYDVKSINNEIISYNKDVKIKEISIYKGVLYNAHLFEISNKTDKSKKINPKAFISLVKNPPKAITVFYNNEVNLLLPFGKAYVVVITRGEQWKIF